MQGMKINLVKYLDRTGDLKIIEENAIKYKNDNIHGSVTKNKLLPLKISIGLDYILLVDIAGDFASLLVAEPNVAKKELSDLIQTSCVVITEWKDITVDLSVRLVSFPKQLTSSENKYIIPGGLFTKSGILAEISPVEKYSHDVSFTCKYKSCNGNGNILKINGACSDCGKNLVEVSVPRFSGEKVVGFFLDPDFLKPSKGYARIQGIAVELRDEIFVGLEIGIKYNVALMIEKGTFLAWGVEPMLPDSLVRGVSNISFPPFPSTISQMISNIKKATCDSPWSLVTAFSSVIPGGSYPQSAFLHLKTALILSLASICSKSPVPILALGNCGTLMMDAWYCSPRAMFSPSGPASLLVASYGVCLVNEYNPGLSYVATAVESELVTITPHKSPKDKRHSTYTLKAAIWMYWNCNKHSGQDVHKLRTLIDVFGIPFLENIDENDRKVSEYILQKAIDDCFSSDIISQKDFRQFIDIISGLKVTMSENAIALIKNYFVASRRERPECLPLKAIKVLTSLSESHARLSLRDTVTFEDVVAAIYLYEESINNLFGPSVSSKFPQRAITVDNPIEIAQQMDKILGKFSQWLQSYTKIPSSSTSEKGDFNLDWSTVSPPSF